MESSGPNNYKILIRGLVATAAATAAIAVATTLGAVGARLSLGYGDIATFKVGAVVQGDSTGGIAVVAHLNEAKTFGPASLAVGNNLYRVNRSGLSKQTSQALFGGAV